MATKAQHTAFNRSVAKYLQSIGAEIKTNTIFHGEWILKTLAGDLNISLHEPERSEVFSIFCRFEEVEKANCFIPWNIFERKRLNTSTGKWNFHSYDADELLNEFKEELQKLLPVAA